MTGSVVQVLRSLRRRHHEAIVLAPGNPPPEFEGTPVVGLPSVPLPGYGQVQVSLASARSLAGELGGFRPDLVYLASPFASSAPDRTSWSVSSAGWRRRSTWTTFGC